MACADEAKEKKRFSWSPDLSGNAQRLDLEVLHVTTYFDTTTNAGGCCAGQEVDDEAAFVSSQPPTLLIDGEGKRGLFSSQAGQQVLSTVFPRAVSI